jgi:hypothetical protein
MNDIACLTSALRKINDWLDSRVDLNTVEVAHIVMYLAAAWGLGFELLLVKHASQGMKLVIGRRTEHLASKCYWCELCWADEFTPQPFDSDDVTWASTKQSEGWVLIEWWGEDW